MVDNIELKAVVKGGKRDGYGAVMMLLPAGLSLLNKPAACPPLLFEELLRLSSAVGGVL